MSNRVTHLLVSITVVGAFLVSTAVRQSASTAAEDGKGLDGRPLTPAGKLVMDVTTRQPAVGALPVGFARSPDHSGPSGGGRYLVAINSGFGIDFNQPNHPRQSLAVIDLNARPEPAVVQNVYFASPQSANVGIVFDPTADGDGTFKIYVSGGFENKIWLLHLHLGGRPPLQPSTVGSSGKIEAEFIDVNGFATRAPSPAYNNGAAPVYPTGLAISPNGREIFVANNLADSLGIIAEPDNERKLARVDLRAENDKENVYPYGVTVLPNSSGGAQKVYVSCWSASAVATVDPSNLGKPVTRIPVEGHPTAMTLNAAGSRLYVVNSGADSVSVIDTRSDKVAERINTKLAEHGPVGNSPEALALSADEATLYVANSHSNSVVVIDLSSAARGMNTGSETNGSPSKIKGFIPTGNYPSALAVVGRRLFIGNGKGTGFKNSSVVVDNTGMSPNLPNDRFPATMGQGGQYILSLVSGNISAVDLPDDAGLSRFTQQTLRNNGLMDRAETMLFKNGSPIKHIIYIIKENRTYDQVFGDVAKAGNGQPADGDPELAILGVADAAARPGGAAQQITPNHHALALRFGLLDRFFVNAEASPDGHNWSTAAFSSDYVDKAYRWNYSGRGRTYDFEGFNRLPDYEPPSELPPVFHLPITGERLADYLKQFVPYLNRSQDAAEPETLYLWDAAARAGLTYRNYGEFIGMVSAADVASINSRRKKSYPDLSPTVATVPTKKSLEGHFCPTTRSFDLYSPDIMTTKTYQAARSSGGSINPAITADGPDGFRGTSRFGAWLAEFRGYVAAINSGAPDPMPNFSMIRLPNDHTAGTRPGQPTPQFYVADNDYALGRLVEEVSSSPYWKDTAIFIVEDDAQAGPDHVDAHRSPALVISAYNRPGALIHSYHTTVSLIRTMELLIGMSPMNQLDANATPIDIFQDTPDLQPYKAVLPVVAEDNLLVTSSRERLTAYWINKSQEQDLDHPDMADPEVLNGAIWFSARATTQPHEAVATLPAADALRLEATGRDQAKNARKPAGGVTAKQQRPHGSVASMRTNRARRRSDSSEGGL
jgi:YVTN family beta-propeller protein